MPDGLLAGSAVEISLFVAGRFFAQFVFCSIFVAALRLRLAAFCILSDYVPILSILSPALSIQQFFAVMDEG